MRAFLARPSSSTRPFSVDLSALRPGSTTASPANATTASSSSSLPPPSFHRRHARRRSTAKSRTTGVQHHDFTTRLAVHLDCLWSTSPSPSPLRRLSFDRAQVSPGKHSVVSLWNPRRSETTPRLDKPAKRSNVILDICRGRCSTHLDYARDISILIASTPFPFPLSAHASATQDDRPNHALLVFSA